MKNITVFCGSKIGDLPAYTEAAQAMAKAFLSRDIGLVYGGGHVGLMGVIANAMLEGGGKVIGIIPRKLVEFEVAHDNLSQLEIVDDMHQRKALMSELADGFITLPGGIGTMEELFEVYTWQNIGYHEKPCGVLNTAGYYDKLIEFLDYQTQSGFLSSEQRQRLIVDAAPEGLLQAMGFY